MRRALWILASVAFLLAVALGASWYEGWVASPWTARYADLVSQLRDRGPMAISGRLSFGVRLRDVPVTAEAVGV